MDNLEFNKILKKAMASMDLEFVSKCVEKLVQCPVDERTPFQICDFAELVPLADDPLLMLQLTGKMYQCNDIYHLYEFLFCMNDSGKKHVPYARLVKSVEESGIAKIMYYCMECIDWCQTAEMERCLVSTGDYLYISAYNDNEEIKKYSPLTVELAINKLKKDNKIAGLEISVPLYYWENLGAYTHTNLTELEALIDISKIQGNPMIINMGAEYEKIKTEDLPAAFRAMMDSNNELHIYEYYCSMKNHPNVNRRLTEKQCDKILNYIANCGNAKIMYYVCAWTDADYDTCRYMQYAIEQTGNQKYIEKVDKFIQQKYGVMV